MLDLLIFVLKQLLDSKYISSQFTIFSAVEFLKLWICGVFSDFFPFQSSNVYFSILIKRANFNHLIQNN